MSGQVLQPQDDIGGLPAPSALTQPFWDGCAVGELRFVRCAECAAADFPPPAWCRWCSAPSLRWERSVGRGSVYSWTVVWRPVTPRFGTPYAPAIVEVDEGYCMLSNLVGLAATEIHIGLRVAVAFHTVAGGRVLPYFSPAV